MRPSGGRRGGGQAGGQGPLRGPWALAGSTESLVAAAGFASKLWAERAPGAFGRQGAKGAHRVQTLLIFSRVLLRRARGRESDRIWRQSLLFVSRAPACCSSRGPAKQACAQQGSPRYFGLVAGAGILRRVRHELLRCGDEKECLILSRAAFPALPFHLPLPCPSSPPLPSLPCSSPRKGALGKNGLWCDWGPTLAALCVGPSWKFSGYLGRS